MFEKVFIDMYFVVGEWRQFELFNDLHLGVYG